MKRINSWLVAAGAALVLCVGVSPLNAQQDNGGGQGGGRRGGQGGPGGGNFDPAAMQQRMLDMTKEHLEITDESEWKAIQPLVEKVFTARRETMSDMGRGMMRQNRNRDNGNTNGAADQNNARRGGFGTPSAESEALQKAIDAKATGAELKAALTKFVENRKAKQAALEKAQADLRKVLSPRQEAIATVNGLL
jgi:hypothetical protein